MSELSESAREHREMALAFIGRGEDAESFQATLAWATMAQAAATLAVAEMLADVVYVANANAV